MLLTLWNYLRGYVIIEVSGFSVERFINLAVHKGVYIWDIKRGTDSTEMKVSIKGFKMLKSCARKTKCKIRIANKVGTPFKIFKYRKRKLLAFGAVFFVFLMFFLSSFIWLITIEGNETFESSELIAFLDKNGLSNGCFKYKIDARELEKKILNDFKNLSWVNITIKGTKATVILTEILPKQEYIDKETPCDIIAEKEGIITSMATSSGTPKVAIGDVVQAGDLLVSSELLVGTDESSYVKKYVHAQSEVRAKMYYEMKFDVSYEYVAKIYTGKIYKDYSLLFVENFFDLVKPKIKYENYDRITTRKQLKFGEDYPLPVIIFCDEYKEFIPQTGQYSIEEAKRVGYNKVINEILSEFDFDVDIYDKDITFTENQDSISVYAFITTIERIDKPIQIESIDIEDEIEFFDTEDENEIPE